MCFSWLLFGSPFLTHTPVIMLLLVPWHWDDLWLQKSRNAVPKIRQLQPKINTSFFILSLNAFVTVRMVVFISLPWMRLMSKQRNIFVVIRWFVWLISKRMTGCINLFVLRVLLLNIIPKPGSTLLGKFVSSIYLYETWFKNWR